MNAIAQLYYSAHNAIFSRLQYLDGLGPLGLRLYLAYVFYMAGLSKIMGIDNTIYWFEHSLELPFPTLMAYLAAYTEYIGAWLLLLGLATRWISIPLMITMVVAALSVHWEHGWFAIAQSSDPDVAVRLGIANDLLREHGRIEWLTEKGSFVILNNGIEFAATYFLMLLALLFTGGGRYTSLDYYLARLWPARG